MIYGILEIETEPRRIQYTYVEYEHNIQLMAVKQTCNWLSRRMTLEERMVMLLEQAQGIGHDQRATSNDPSEQKSG